MSWLGLGPHRHLVSTFQPVVSHFHTINFHEIFLSILAIGILKSYQFLNMILYCNTLLKLVVFLEIFFRMFLNLFCILSPANKNNLTSYFAIYICLISCSRLCFSLVHQALYYKEVGIVTVSFLILIGLSSVFLLLE